MQWLMAELSLRDGESAMSLVKQNGERLRFDILGTGGTSVATFELDPDDCEAVLKFIATFGGE